MKIRNIAEAGILTFVSAICLGASHGVAPFSPIIGWIMLALGVVALLLAIECAADTPVIHWLCDRAWESRSRRERAERMADKLRYDAALEKGLAVSRAMGAAARN